MVTFSLWAIVFPHSSVGKESTCNSGDPSSIPGLGSSAGEGIGYPFQYSWASLVSQLVKNPPTMRETWVLSLGWEDPLKKGKATHSSILAWRIPWTVWPMGGIAKGWTWLSDFHFTSPSPYVLMWLFLCVFLERAQFLFWIGHQACWITVLPIWTHITWVFSGPEEGNILKDIAHSWSYIPIIFKDFSTKMGLGDGTFFF